MQTLQEIANVLKNLKSAVIFTHTRPDGDTLGSGLALYYAFEELGIPCEICNDSDIPPKFSFLKGIERIQKHPTMSDVQAYIAVDSADLKRLGIYEDLFLRAGKKITVNIDHHISNVKYATYNYVHCCPANCQNMAELLPLMGVQITSDIANALMTGLITDSGTFSHSDVTGDTYRVAGQLCDQGANVNEITYNMFRKQSKARAALYGATMSEIRYLLDDKLAVIVVTRQMMEKYGADQAMTEGFVDFPLSVDTVEVAVSILETKFRQYKVSFRSKGKTNVNAIASVFGGGGHILASGCMLFGDLEEVIDKLRYTVSQYME